MTMQFAVSHSQSRAHPRIDPIGGEPSATVAKTDVATARHLRFVSCHKGAQSALERYALELCTTQLCPVSDAIAQDRHSYPIISRYLTIILPVTFPT